MDSDEAGSYFSKEGPAHYADVKRAQLFATENQRALQISWPRSPLNLQSVGFR